MSAAPRTLTIVRRQSAPKYVPKYLAPTAPAATTAPQQAPATAAGGAHSADISDDNISTSAACGSPRLPAAVETLAAAQGAQAAVPQQAAGRARPGRQGRGGGRRSRAAKVCGQCGTPMPDDAAMCNHAFVRHSETARAEALALLSARIDADLAIRVDAGIFQICARMRPDSAREAREALVLQVGGAVRQVLPSARVAAFGSFVSGMWSTSSDVDITVLPPSGAKVRDVSVLRRLYGPVSRMAADPPTLVAHARVPVLKVSGVAVRSHPLHPPLAFDLVVGRELGVTNSLLLRDYMGCDPRAALVVTAARLWAKERGVTGGANAYMTPYALSLLAIVHMQMLGVLPRLQATPEWPVTRVSTREGVTCEWSRDVTWCSAAKLGVSDILFRFFVWLGASVDWMHSAVCSRRGLVVDKSSTKWADDVIVIIDPFEELNAARGVAPSKLDEIIDEARRAAQTLCGLAPHSDVLAELLGTQ
eukprot:m51a1_g200 hypothetical protein (476) ;mRNA; r:659474-660982